MVDEVGTLGLLCWSGQSRGMETAHRHLDLEINYVLSGTMTYLVAGNLVDLPQRRLCLLWGGVPHQMLRRPHAVEVIWVTIPLTTVLRWGLPGQLIRPLLTGGFIADSAPRPGDLDLLHQWLEDLPRPSNQNGISPNHTARDIVLLEIEARLRRIALNLARYRPSASEARCTLEGPSDGGLEAVQAMAQFITAHFRETIGTVEIAAAAHLHPNYAMTLFRKHTGVTLSQYLILQRIAHAQRRLVTSADAIEQIALECGFGSVSRFYEAFRQQTGNSPRRFRLQMHATPRYTSIPVPAHEQSIETTNPELESCC